ncbi:exodeoxyribonuclease VII large subunit [Brevirhabdus pacifica]|uniref:Exodeoxyribonuclease 7 large subunit n=2 Tax=Brevirhabdus pacifica TaxID=1267768 RepID=A0A1U7DH39_9RHOB|nr:exodeoxyribonuclease VII large subunit [Brevirhabdus pacifica]APX89310.1 exodeoxyribonuclease VII large subunit [Brevirhabdus pacifica]OWU76658.1 exodeoxyribonuclease VII large subunit [Loktanella sp. 22II-4b]PJJ86071.1 exodeoxyribonuclease VII large subunit [Brevirhabdus pacifica]
MSDLIDDPEPGQNAPEFTVSELSGAVKRSIEGEFARVRVRGEVGRVSRPRSGHVYLDLKDDRSVLAGVIWKGVCSRLATQPEEGMEVVATGRLTTFPGQSKYQMVIEEIAPAGVGALMALLEKRRQMFQAEGLFDAGRKRALPFLPEVIGVVTSPSGAVIRDILHRLRDRFPRKVLIWPVAVQGKSCAPEVARALAGFNALTPGGALPRPDLLIVARGGGSIEDLWGFNEEEVVRAVAASRIPVISAVGHETDTTLIDHVADRRAPTPTAAAELAVPVRLELMAGLDQMGARLSRCVAQAVATRRQRAGDLARAMPRLESLLDSARQRNDGAEERLKSALRHATQHKRTRLEGIAGPLRPGLLRRAMRAEGERLSKAAERLRPCLDTGLRERRSALAKLSAGLRPRELRRDIANRAEALARLDDRMRAAFEQAQGRRRDRLEATERLRQTLGYVETLGRGYAVIRSGEHVLTDRAAAAAAGRFEVEFRDGRLDVAVTSGAPGTGSGQGGKGPSRPEPAPAQAERAAKPAPAPARKPKAPPPGQGSLFD